MAHRTFDFSALQYLNQWLIVEENFCKKINSTAQEDRFCVLERAASSFKIARNLPKKYEKGCQRRYQPIIEIMDKVNLLTNDNAINKIKEVESEISEKYGGNGVLSLTTKFLWIKFKSPVRIYDAQVKKALKAKNLNYEDFNEKFDLRFKKHQNEIVEACRNLKNVISYTARPRMSPQEVDLLVSNRWFEERVLDIFLWNEGVA